jgi:hypothetical protein
VVDGGDDQITGITISHEVVHALQAQHFNLDSMQAARDNNDRAVAGHRWWKDRLPWSRSAR